MIPVIEVLGRQSSSSGISYGWVTWKAVPRTHVSTSREHKRFIWNIILGVHVRSFQPNLTLVDAM
jgi:hypothetical protein